MNQNEDLLKKIDILRRGNKEFITNAFFSAQSLESLCNSAETTMKISDDVIIVLLEEEHLIRLYFYAADYESLRHIPLLMPKKTKKAVIADIVGKNPKAAKLSAELERHDFYKYSELIRMNRKNEKSIPGTVLNVMVAEADHANEILDILYEEFDIYKSHLPNLQNLKDGISAGEVTIVTEQDVIAGLAYFVKLGERLKYLYQIAVRKNYRGSGIADNLLMCAFKKASIDTIFQLWVETQNKPAIRMYQKHCFAPDGLFDYIMLYKGNV